MRHYYNCANVRTVLLLNCIRVGLVFWQTAADSWEFSRPNTGFTMLLPDNMCFQKGALVPQQTHLV